RGGRRFSVIPLCRSQGLQRLCRDRSRAFRRSVADDPHYVYVPNGRPGTVEVIDPVTFKIVRTIDLGYGAYPEHVTPSWNMRWLYVDVDGLNELAVIDPRTGKIVRTIQDRKSTRLNSSHV